MIEYNRVANKLIKSESLSDKLWTKKEWEEYVEKHPNTKVNPQFVKDDLDEDDIDLEELQKLGIFEELDYDDEDFSIDSEFEEMATNDIIDDVSSRLGSGSHSQKVDTINELVDSHINNHFVRDRIAKKYENEDFSLQNELVDSYVGAGYENKDGGSFSSLVGRVFSDFTDDYRMKTYGFEDYNDEETENMRKYMSMEQEIIKESGFVDDEGYVVLFRNLDYLEAEKGDFVEYHGSHVESWTLSPSVDMGNSASKDLKIMTRVPVEYIVASSVGRDSINETKKDIDRKNWQFLHDESEVIVYAGNITGVAVVGSKRDASEEAIDSYSNTLKKNHKNKDKNIKQLNLNSNKKQNILNDLNDIDNPTFEELRDMMRDSQFYLLAKNKSPIDLLIMFKTLRKRGEI